MFCFVIYLLLFFFKAGTRNERVCPEASYVHNSPGRLATFCCALLCVVVYVYTFSRSLSAPLPSKVMAAAGCLTMALAAQDMAS